MQMRSAVTVFLAITAMVVFAGSAGAMPHLARNLSMECGECHLTVPKLSLTGLEFKADGFAFDDITPVKGKIDFSAQIQARYKNETH